MSKHNVDKPIHGNEISQAHWSPKPTSHNSFDLELLQWLSCIHFDPTCIKYKLCFSTGHMLSQVSSKHLENNIDSFFFSLDNADSTS